MLTDLEIIHRNAPINKLDDNKKSTFEINDNLLRFYYTYVYKNGSALQMLGAEKFYDAYIGPTLLTFISKRFEEICRCFLSIQVQEGKMTGIRNIGTYYYDDAKNHKNGEFDVAVQTENGCDIYEVKYYSDLMDSEEIHREVGQINDITEMRIRNIGFISINGFQEREEGYIYYSGSDLY